MGDTKVLIMVLSQKDLYGVLPNAVGAMKRLDRSSPSVSTFFLFQNFPISLSDF